MPRSSTELQIHAKKLGLDTSGSREDLMNRIRDYLVLKHELDVVPQIEPMVAHNAKDYLDYNLEKPWRSPALMNLFTSDTVAVEPKLDGVRVKAHFNKQYQVNPRLDSRRRSDVNFIYSERTDNFPHLHVDINKFPIEMQDMILDGEMIPQTGINKIFDGIKWIEGLQIATSIWNSGKDASLNLQRHAKRAGENLLVVGCNLNYHAFDILRYNGEYLFDDPWYMRRELLQNIVMPTLLKLAFNGHLNPPYHTVPVWPNNPGSRVLMFEKLIEAGGEGIMFKKRDSLYRPGKRSWDWLKLKRFVECSAFITGYVPADRDKGWAGLVGAFEVSVYAGDKPTQIAAVSAMPLEMRRDATAPDGTLNPAYLNKVVEVRFQQLTTRSNRGRHAVMVRFREDQNQYDCTMNQSGLQDSGSEMLE